MSEVVELITIHSYLSLGNSCSAFGMIFIGSHGSDGDEIISVGGGCDGVLLGIIVSVSVVVRVGATVLVRVGVRVNVGVIVRVTVGVNVRVGVGEMNPIGVRVGVAEGPARVRVRVGVLLTLGVAEGTAVQVEVLAGSFVGVVEASSALLVDGVAVPPKLVEASSVTIAVRVSATAVSI